MPRKAQFFDRSGRRISEAEAHDERGIIRDGVISRVPMTMADAADPRLHFPRQRPQFGDARQLFDSGQVCVTDATGSGGNRPGWRLSDSPINRRALYDAKASYLHDIENAHKNPPTGFGEQGARGSQEGQKCTKNGWPGVLVRGPSGELYCDIDGHDAAPDKNWDDDETDERARIYDTFCAELQNAWRRGK